MIDLNSEKGNDNIEKRIYLGLLRDLSQRMMPVFLVSVLHEIPKADD